MESIFFIPTTGATLIAIALILFVWLSNKKDERKSELIKEGLTKGYSAEEMQLLVGSNHNHDLRNGVIITFFGIGMCIGFIIGGSNGGWLALAPVVLGIGLGYLIYGWLKEKDK